MHILLSLSGVMGPKSLYTGPDPRRIAFAYLDSFQYLS